MDPGQGAERGVSWFSLQAEEEEETSQSTSAFPKPHELPSHHMKDTGSEALCPCDRSRTKYSIESQKVGAGEE